MSILDKITGKTSAVPTPEDGKETSAVKPTVVKKEKDNQAGGSDFAFGILVAPIMTEKSSGAEKNGKYTFLVASSAGKIEIAKAFNKRYGLKPIKINVVNSLGKVKRFGGNWGKRKDFRKAIITLPKGKTINVYDSK
jgi:large subunit ribosomal protein L23